MIDEAGLKFIEENRNADTTKLRLRFHGQDDVVKLIDQIDLRRKAGDKFMLPDGRSIAPKYLYSGVSVEQATSARIAAFHASLASTAKTVLDLTMGMGIDAAAFALLNGAVVTGLELNGDLADLSSKNYSDHESMTVINADANEWLKGCDEQFDLIFVDPSRRADDGSRVHNVHDCRPDVVALMDEIKRHSGRLMVKLSPMLDLKSVSREIPEATAIYVVEERGECREILADAKFDEQTEEPEIVARNEEREFRFRFSEESAANGEYGRPKEGDYLYEPWASVMKAGPFKLLCEIYNCKALGANSHLYFSENEIEDFPGKCYRVAAALPYQSSIIKRFAKRYGNASVAVRNFGDSAEKVRQKLGVKESSEQRVIATTDNNGTKLLLLLRACIEPITCRKG